MSETSLIQRPWLLTGAQAGRNPSLDLKFLAAPLDPRITFTRTSTATYFDSGGTMQTAATNAPRFDYDPATHVLRGLLIEEARTNLLLNSATLGTQSVAVTAQPYTLSFYGTGTVTLSGTSTAGPLVGTGAFPARVALTFTPTAGTLTCTVTGSVLSAQLEAGAFVTTYIPTTAAPVGRAADVLTMPTDTWYNQAAGSLSANVTLSNWQQPSGNRSGGVFTLDDGAGNRNNAIDMIAFTNAVTFMQPNTSVRVGSATTGSISYTNLNLTGITSIGIGMAWGAATTAAACNGNATQSAALTGLPTANRLTIGGGYAGILPLGGYIRRVRYWPRTLSNSELQSVTR